MMMAATMAHGEPGAAPYGVASRTFSAENGRRAAVIVAAQAGGLIDY